MSDAAELQALLKRGFSHLARGEIDAAARCCQEALRRKPDLVPGHFLVGLVALEAHDRKTAFSAFGSVTKLQKDRAAAWASYSCQSRTMRRFACLSSYKQLFADACLHLYEQREMARHHARYWRLMNIWRERFGERFLDVSYEETVQDIEPAAVRAGSKRRPSSSTTSFNE